MPPVPQRTLARTRYQTRHATANSIHGPPLCRGGDQLQHVLRLPNRRDGHARSPQLAVVEVARLPRQQIDRLFLAVLPAA